MGALDLITAIGKGLKKQTPFFSRVDEALEGLKREKGTPEEFLRELEKQPGVKKAELEERGIKKAVAARAKAPDAKKPILKEKMRQILQENPPPKVQEKVLTSDVPDYDDFLEAKAQELYGVDYFDLSGAEKATIKKMFDEIPATQYDKYKTPGGENYREILLKLPSFNNKRITELEAELLRSESAYRDPMSMPHVRAMVEELQALKAQQAKAGSEYVSSHYKTEPNLLAHIRVQDFKTPEGKKVLLVDEIQSDWHQQGRKSGYKTGFEEGDMSRLANDIEDLAARRRELLKQAEAMPDGGPEFIAVMDEANSITPQLMRLQGQYDNLRAASQSGVPDAPFKKNWHELAMKRVLDYAAENGYDTVAITPGAEQAKRYDLSKQVSEVIASPYTKDSFSIMVKDNAGRVTNIGEKKIDELPSLVGKELAEKISSSGGGSFSGLDLQVGGEGMKGFYDKILPDYLSNFGKPYGASVGEIDLITKPGREVPQIAAPGLGHFPEPIIEPAKTMKAWSFDITPQLREQVKSKGLPLYSRIGMGPEGLAAGTGAATIGATQQPQQPEQQVQNPVHFTENPDAMRLELMQRN